LHAIIKLAKRKNRDKQQTTNKKSKSKMRSLHENPFIMLDPQFHCNPIAPKHSIIPDGFVGAGNR